MDPLYFLPLYAFARADDDRFSTSTDIATLNDSQYTIATLEGGATATIQRQQFYNSKLFELPQLTSPSELFVSLSMGKADYVIYDRFTFHEYDDRNPGKLRRISEDPVKIFPNAVAIKRNEFEFLRLLNHALRELKLNGALDEIVARHQKHPGTLLSVPPLYVR